MPNYVYSTLSLEGSKDDIKRFREKFEEKGSLIATKVIPYPRELELLDKKENEKELTNEEEKELILIGLEGKYDMSKGGYNQGGYNWCIEEWGTKWGFCYCSVSEESDDYLLYEFSTAWSPINRVIIEMSKQFPNITLDYFCDEESGAFRDEVTYLNGIETAFEDKTYECDEERRQEEEDYKLGEEENKRRMDDKMKEKNNG